MKQIIATIDTIGNTEIETKGFRGKGCVDATKQLESALGKVKSERKTREFYQREGTASRTLNAGG